MNSKDYQPDTKTKKVLRPEGHKARLHAMVSFFLGRNRKKYVS